MVLRSAPLLYGPGVDRGLPEGDFVDAGDVASAFEWGREECVDDFAGGFDGDESCGHYEDVGVVVGASEGGEFGLPAESRADALMFVEGH